MIDLFKKTLLAVALGLIVASPVTSLWAADENESAEVTPDKAVAEKPVADQPTVEKATPEQIAAWIKSLDDEAFGTRQAASQKLFEAGKAAVEPLSAAAASDSLEVALNAVDVLRRLTQGTDADAKSAAKSSLEKLAKSENSSLASRATEALKEPPKPADNGDVNGIPPGIIFGGAPGGIIIRGGAIPGGVIIRGGIQIPGNGIGLNVTSRSESDVNGVHSVEVENGEGKFSIVESKDNVKVSSTKSVGGKDVTENYEAKSVDELKEKKPDGFAIYQKYARAGVRAGANAVPAANAEAIRTNALRQSLKSRIAAAVRMIDSAKRSSSEFKDEKTQKAIEKLEKARKLVEEAGKDLEP